MRIRKLKIKNYKMFDDLELDFTDSDGKSLDVIVLAGLNGSGKTSILELLGKLFSESSNRFKIQTPLEDFEKEPDGIICDKIVAEFESTPEEVGKWINLVNELSVEIKRRLDIKNPSAYSSVLKSHKKKLSNRTKDFSFLYEIENTPKGFFIKQNDFLPFGLIPEEKLFKFFRVLYFVANSLEVKSERNIIDISDFPVFKEKVDRKSDGIVQLVDIFSEKKNIEQYIVEAVMQNVIEKRELTGKEAIENRVREINDLLHGIRLSTKLIDITPKKPVFKTFNDKKISIDDLSSGEKQLYYRAAFLNKLALTNSLIMIDEPETSLHPTWQREVLKLYKNAGKNNQIILATHSPHIIASVKPEHLFILYVDETTKQVKVMNMAKEERYTKGVEPNRILQEIMGMDDLRDTETQNRINDIANIILQYPENTDNPVFQEKVASLTRDLGPQDPDVMRINHQLFMIRRKRQSDK